MPSLPAPDEHGLAALVELLRRNAEAMEAGRASNAAVAVELSRLSHELRVLGDRLAKVEDAIADQVALERTRVEARKQGWAVVSGVLRSPIAHAVAVAIIGAVLQLVGMGWLARQIGVIGVGGP